MTYPRRGLISSLIVGGILVLGGDAVGGDRPTRIGDGGDPAVVADRFAGSIERWLNTGFQDLDIADLKPIVCVDDYALYQRMAREMGQPPQTPPTPDARLSGSQTLTVVARVPSEMVVSDLRVDGNLGSFTLMVNGTTQLGRVGLRRDDGVWRVCGTP